MRLADHDPAQPRRSAPVGLLLGAMVGSLVAARFETVVPCVLGAILGATLSGVKWPSTRWVRALAIGLLLSLILNLFLTPGQPLGGLEIGSFRPTREGLFQGMLLALRIVGASWGLMGLSAAWSRGRAADELGRLVRPLERMGVPIGESRLVSALAVRFAPLLGDEAKRIARAQDLRAGRAPIGIKEWFQRRRAVVIPTMVGALERAERTALALEARHYEMRPIAGAHPLRSRWGLLGIALAGTALLWRR